MEITLDTDKLTLGQLNRLMGMVTEEEDFFALQEEVERRVTITVRQGGKVIGTVRLL